MFPKYIFSLLCLIPLCQIPLCSIPISYTTFRYASFHYTWFQIAHFNVMTDSCSLLCLIPLYPITLCLIPVLMKPCYAWFRYTWFRYTWFHFCMLYPIPLCQVPPSHFEDQKWKFYNNSWSCVLMSQEYRTTWTGWYKQRALNILLNIIFCQNVAAYCLCGDFSLPHLHFCFFLVVKLIF